MCMLGRERLSMLVLLCAAKNDWLIHVGVRCCKVGVCILQSRWMRRHIKGARPQWLVNGAYDVIVVVALMAVLVLRSPVD